MKEAKVQKSKENKFKKELKKAKVDQSEIGVVKEEILNSQLKEEKTRIKTKRQRNKETKV